MPRELATLQHLRAIICDSVAGYHKAAERARSPELKSALLSVAATRHDQFERLNEQIGGADGQIICEGTALGDLHRLWLDVTSVLAGGDLAVIRRVREGDAYLVRQLEAALASDALSGTSFELAVDLLATVHRDRDLTELLTSDRAT
jgi:uncharacterized protein (TIGR02284 family)